MMRIALVYDVIYPEVIGGVQKRLWEVARRLAASGHDVHLFATKHWAGPSVIERAGVKIHGIRSPRRLYTRTGRRSIFQGVVFAVRVALRLAVARFNVVEVQAAAPLSCLTTSLVCKAKGIPLVITWHEVWNERWFDYLGGVGVVGRGIERSLARLGGWHLAVSEMTAARVRELGCNRVSVVSNATDPDQIAAIRPASLRSDIVYAGRLTQEKNIDVLIEAASHLRDAGIQPVITISGEGPLRESLEVEAARRGLDNVRFVGSLTEEETLALMKAASIFVLPSTREGFGIAALEAACCGLPIITIDHADNAARHLITEGITGFLVPLSPEELAGRIAELLQDENLRSKMSSAATRFASRSSWGRVSRQLESIYIRASTSQRHRLAEA